MEFRGICIETNNVEEMRTFYSMVLKMKGEGDHVHSQFPKANLAIYNPYIGENRKVLSNEEKSSNFVLMFQVEDVDYEYSRLKENGVVIISEPETKPWGTRAFSFVDLDGNRINFLSVAKRNEKF